MPPTRHNVGFRLYCWTGGIGEERGGFSYLLGKVRKLVKGKGEKFGKVALSIALGLCAVLLGAVHT
jgi:hypothetical protein